jgi:hypothetical protein
MTPEAHLARLLRARLINVAGKDTTMSEKGYSTKQHLEKMLPGLHHMTPDAGRKGGQAPSPKRVNTRLPHDRNTRPGGQGRAGR